MGVPDTLPSTSDRTLPVISLGADHQRYANRMARAGYDAAERGVPMQAADRRAAVRYCISNDLI